MFEATEDDVRTTILELERKALERWGQGDPDGFLEISAPDVSYFDPYQPKRLDDREALAALYETLRGAVKIDVAEIIAPRVQVLGDTAVLSYRFGSEGGGGQYLWNCTEVYRRLDGEWRIVHTHWSMPEKKA